MRLPDFLIIGAQKSGTTAAMSNIACHPHVNFNLANNGRHELHFFDADEKWKLGPDWYRQHFTKPAPLLGEKTPNYFQSHAIRRIKQILPHAKLLVLLRDPVKRAYSQWNHFNQNPAAAGTGWRVCAFERALRERPTLRRYGHYDEALEAVYAEFPRDQVHVAISERVWRDPQAEYAHIFAFLGLQAPAGQVYVSVHQRAYLQLMSTATEQSLGQYFAPHIERTRLLLRDDLTEWSRQE
jgi:hypothetical protein